MCKLLKVSGSSLLPVYQDGDFVIVSKIPYLFGPIRPGDVIAFRHERYGIMIKQVESISPGQDQIYVVGTQKNSIDSRRFGLISRRDVLGKAVWHIKKPGR